MYKTTIRPTVTYISEQKVKDILVLKKLEKSNEESLRAHNKNRRRRLESRNLTLQKKINMYKNHNKTNDGVWKKKDNYQG